MFSLKRFKSFEECKIEWQELENNTFHYPFQSWWYQKLFSDKFIAQENLYLLGIYEDNNLISIGGFEKIGTEIIFVGMKLILGRPDMGVTDYGDLLLSQKVTEGDVEKSWVEIERYFKLQKVNLINLEFVREDSLTYKYFQSKDSVKISIQEVSPFLNLPATWDEYLAELDRKERHELRRKIKRLEAQKCFHFCTDQSAAEDFEEFVRLHRLSDPDKAVFMTDEMKTLFWNIVAAEKTDWDVSFCNLNIDKKQVASVMYFENKDQILLYNSGFDPEYNYFSVGVILKAYLIKKSIEQKKQIYDLLRGDERYKYDLGAKDITLYKIEVSLA